MSKKIESILNKATDQYKITMADNGEHSRHDLVRESILDDIVDEFAEKLRYFTMHQLNKINADLSKEIRLATQEQLAAQQEEGLVNNELSAQIKIDEFKEQIITRAITIKQDYQKQYSHPFEKNILDHGLFNASTPNEKTLSTMRTDEGIIEHTKDGFRRIYYRNENGYLLSSYDTKIFIGLMKLWEEKGKQSKFSFDFIDLIHVTESENSGRQYQYIENSIDNLAKMKIVMEEYMDPKSGKRTRTKIHSPITDAEIIRDPHNRINRVEIEFNHHLHDSLIAGHFIKINISLFNDLANSTSKHLYLYLSTAISDAEDTLSLIDMDKLIEHLGIFSSSRAKCIKQIKDAFAELQDYHVIKSFEVIKHKNRQKYISFIPSDWFVKEKITPLLESGDNHYFFEK